MAASPLLSPIAFLTIFSFLEIWTSRNGCRWCCCRNCSCRCCESFNFDWIYPSSKDSICLGIFQTFSLDKGISAKLPDQVLPIICNEVLIGVGNMMINVVLGRQSEQAIAAVAVFRTMEGLVIAFFSGFSNAARFSLEKKLVPAITSLPLSALNVWFICAAPL